MTKKQRFVAGVAGVALVAWGALFFSNRGVLVWGGIDTDREVVKVLECHYFTGTGIVTRDHLHGKVLGRESCPRWIKLSGR